jgi:hypothetical protein
MQDWSHNAAAFTNSKQTGRVIQITLLRYANLRGVPTHLSTVLHTVWAGWILSLVTFGYIVLKNIWIYSVRNILYYRYMDWIPPPVWGLVRPIGDVIRTIGNRLTSIRHRRQKISQCVSRKLAIFRLITFISQITQNQRKKHFSFGIGLSSTTGNC